MKKTVAICTLLLVSGFVSLARASVIVDQDQSVWEVRISAFDQSYLGQSFQTQANNVAGAGVRIWGYSTDIPGDITISLYDGLPDQGGNLLRSGTALGIYATEWAEAFWEPIAVEPNTDLFLFFRSTEPRLFVAGSEGNPYPYGKVYTFLGPYPTMDYAFRTYTETDFIQPVPEPSTMLLLGTGLVGLAGLRRRFRK